MENALLIMTLLRVMLIDFIKPWLLLILATSAIYGSADDEPVANIRKLRKDLMSHYDKFALPVMNLSAPVPVGIQMLYLALSELNELEERMVVNTVMMMSWKDEHLQWDPNQYNGIEEMIFPENDVWLPDAVVGNSAPITENLAWNKTSVIVKHDGTVYWYPPASISVRCPMSLMKPTEERLCNLTTGSYSYFSYQLQLRLLWTEMDIVANNDNPTWMITNVTASLETITFGSLDYSWAAFSVSLKRKYDFTGEVVRGPRTVAILLTLSMFWLPSSSDRKLNLGCLVMIVLCGMIMYLSSTVVSPSLLASTVVPLRNTLFTAVSALLIEIIVINLTRVSDIVKPSPIVVPILSGMVGRVVGVCSRVEYKGGTEIVELPQGEEESSEKNITVEEEWSLVAMALDRIFFIVYSVIFIALS